MKFNKYLVMGAVAGALALPAKADAQWITTPKRQTFETDASRLCEPRPLRAERSYANLVRAVTNANVALNNAEACADSYKGANPRVVRSGAQHDSVSATPLAHVKFTDGDTLDFRINHSRKGEGKPAYLRSTMCPDLEGALRDARLTPDELRRVRPGSGCTLYLSFDTDKGLPITTAIHLNKIDPHFARQRLWGNTYFERDLASRKQ